MIINGIWKTFISVVSSAVLLSGITLPVLANHNPGSAPLDLAIKGTNLPGYTNLGQCEYARPNKGCMLIYSDCNGSGYDIYTTEYAAEVLNRAAGEGQKIIVHTMTNGGHFDKRICSIYKG